MQYAQLNPDGSYSHQITTSGNVEWDENHFCPASALTAEEAILFRVVPLLETAPPTFDAITQACQRNGGELVGAQWQYKWDVATLDATTATANLAAAKDAAWGAIKAKRDALSDSGGYLVSGKWFHSDEKSKTQQLGLFIMGANVPAVQWKTMSGDFVTMSQALAAGIFQAAAAQDMAIFAAAETHKAAMETSADPAAYNFSAGWPDTFPG